MYTLLRNWKVVIGNWKLCRKLGVVINVIIWKLGVGFGNRTVVFGNHNVGALKLT